MNWTQCKRFVTFSFISRRLKHQSQTTSFSWILQKMSLLWLCFLWLLSSRIKMNLSELGGDSQLFHLRGTEVSKDVFLKENPTPTCPISYLPLLFVSAGAFSSTAVGHNDPRGGTVWYETLLQKCRLDIVIFSPTVISISNLKTEAALV